MSLQRGAAAQAGGVAGQEEGVWLGHQPLHGRAGRTQGVGEVVLGPQGGVVEREEDRDLSGCGCMGETGAVVGMCDRDR